MKGLAIASTLVLSMSIGDAAVIITYPDGHVNAPVGTPQFAGMLNGYATRPPWQVAGVDYAVGIHPGASLKDPMTISNPGISIDYGAQQIYVQGNSITLDGYDFTMEGGWGVEFDGANGILSNSKITMGSVNGGIYVSSSATNTIIRFNEIDGQGMSGQGGFVFGSEFGFTTPLAFNGAGQTTLRYNYIHDAYGQVMTNGSLVGGETYVIEYNVIANGGEGTSAGAHGDLMQTFQPDSSYANSNIKTYTVQYNLFVQNVPVSDNGIATMGITMNGMPGNVGTWTISNNTLVAASGSDVGWGICFIDYTHVISAINLQNNYIDMSGVQYGWSYINNTGVNTDGVNGTHFPAMNVTGNINMLNGAALN